MKTGRFPKWSTTLSRDEYKMSMLFENLYEEIRSTRKRKKRRGTVRVLFQEKPNSDGTI